MIEARQVECSKNSKRKLLGRNAIGNGPFFELAEEILLYSVERLFRLSIFIIRSIIHAGTYHIERSRHEMYIDRYKWINPD